MKDFEIKLPDMAAWARNLEADFLGARRAGMINIVADIEALAVKGAPKRTSNLANSGSSNVNEGGTKGTITFSAPYAEFVHEGTGLYGPHKTNIVPKNKKALFWPGAGHPFGSVKGMVGRPFLMDAAKATDPNRSFTEGVNNYLALGRGR
ncbi:MAG: hypothetical protein M0P16_00525 [Syntrophales bacterium]|jgi:hypothetical protein|nr:hypothetical protein [Syntrophales bacterium]MCK9390271.1 hypothetical protein [Syntrophales bacterium]